MSYVGLVMVVEQLSERLAPARLSVSPCSAGPSLVVVIGGEADWMTADRLREGLIGALAYGPRSVVLDLTDLVFCDLQGLRALVAGVETAERAGVAVTLHGMSRQLTWLYDFFQAGRRSQGRQCRSLIPDYESPRAAARGVPIV